MASELAGEMNDKAAAAADPVKRAYVTFVAGADDGEPLETVVRLAESLGKVGAAYPLVVAVLPDVPESQREFLVSRGCVVREVKPVYPPEKFDNCSMLRVWEFVKYERMVYLDASMRVLGNIDALFELQKGYFYAAEFGSPPASYFNAGGVMFVHEPSLATAEALLHVLPVTPPESLMKQGFLNMFFRDQYRPIPLECNSLVRATIIMAHPDEDVQLDGARRPWTLKLLATKAAALARQNLPAMATLAASSATLGVVITGASNPMISFGFYAGFIAAMAIVMVSIRGI